MLIISLFAFGVYQNPPPVKTSTDIALIIFICVVPFGTTVNCIHNISLLNYQIAGKKFSVRRKVFFWSFLFFLAGVAAIISFVLASSYSNLEHIKEQNLSGNKTLFIKALLMYFTMLAVVLNGIYIGFLQVVLFFQVKKRYDLNVSLAVNEIGMEKPL